MNGVDVHRQVLKFFFHNRPHGRFFQEHAPMFAAAVGLDQRFAVKERKDIVQYIILKQDAIIVYSHFQMKFRLA